jgi:hypothetical protein
LEGGRDVADEPGQHLEEFERLLHNAIERYRSVLEELAEM